MSVLNQMLRDLARRGADAAPRHSAGIASAAPPMPTAPQRANALRRAIWGGLVLAICATLAAYAWQAERMKAQAKVAAPLGIDQFGAALPAADISASRAAAGPAASTAARSTSDTVASNAVASGAVASNAVESGAVESGAVESGAVESKPVASNSSQSAPAAVRAAQSHDARPPPDAAPSESQSKSPAVAVAREAPASRTSHAMQTPRAIAARPDVVAAAPPAAAVVTHRDGGEQRLARIADLIARGRSVEAIEQLTQVLDMQPQQHAARQALAALQAESGRRDLALQTMLAGIDTAPTRFAIPAARLQAEFGDAQGALSTLDRVPPPARDAEFDALAGGIAQRAGQHASAAESFARAVRSPRAQPAWWAGWALSQEALGQTIEARSSYARAAADPALPAALRPFVEQRLADLATGRAGASPAARDTAPLAALPR